MVTTVQGILLGFSRAEAGPTQCPPSVIRRAGSRAWHACGVGLLSASHQTGRSLCANHASRVK